MGRAVVCLLIAAILGVAPSRTPALEAQVRTEAADLIQPQGIDAEGKKRPKGMGRPARDRIKNKKIKQAHEYDVTGGDTLVSTTEFDNHGNAVRKHHRESPIENTEVDTTRDVITKITDARHNTEMAFQYSDDDTALRVITIKQPNRADTKLNHDYDESSRLKSVVSEVPTDSTETGPRGRTNTTIQYDGDTDNVTSIAVTGAADATGPDRMISRVDNTYDQGRLVRQDFYHNAKFSGPDSMVVVSVRDHVYTPTGLLEKITTTDPADMTSVIVETHSYDGDGNEIRMEHVTPYTKLDGTRSKRKTVTMRTFDDGLLTRETVDNLLDEVLTTSHEKRIEYKK